MILKHEPIIWKISITQETEAKGPVRSSRPIMWAIWGHLLMWAIQVAPISRKKREGRGGKKKGKEGTTSFSLPIKRQERSVTKTWVRHGGYNIQY